MKVNQLVPSAIKEYNGPTTNIVPFGAVIVTVYPV
jgi:hypothetical protein